MGACTSSNTQTIVDDVPPTPDKKPPATPQRHTQTLTCGSLFCLSGAGVDVPERTTGVRRISVQSNGAACKGAPPTRPRGRVFEICDVRPGRRACNGKARPSRLAKISEENQLSTTQVEKFTPSPGEGESPRSSSTVPKLPPLFTPRPLPTIDGDTSSINQCWEALVKEKQNDTVHHSPERPVSRADITRDVNIRSPRGPPKTQKTRVMWEASYDTTGRLSNICDVAFLRSDCIAVSQDSTDKLGLQLFDVARAGLPGDVIGEPEICSPRGVCLDRDGHVVVTDAHSQTVKFMDTYGNYLASWKHGKFRLPAGIAQTRDGQFVVSDERGGDKAIGLYSGRGTVIRKFGMPWFDCPWYVAVDNYNRVLVSEQSVSGVIVFDNHGRYLFKFGSQGGGEGQLNFQSGIAVDSQNQVLVADSDNYRVCLFSPDGYFIENVVTNLPSRPVSLSLYEPQSLLAVVTETMVYLHHMNDAPNSARFQ